MLKEELYTDMMEKDEMWFVYGPGAAFLIYDLPICDL